MSESAPTHRETLRRTAQEYRRRGYDVKEAPSREALPGFLTGLSPDLIASKGGDRVVVEIKRADRLKGSNDLTDLAARVADHPDWRFELITLAQPEVTGAERPSAASLARLLQGVLAGSHADDPALRGVASVVLLSTLERLLRWFALERGLSVKDRPAPAIVHELGFVGLLDEDALSVLDRIPAWDEPLLAGKPFEEPLPQDVVDQLVPLCRTLHAGLLDAWDRGGMSRIEIPCTRSAISELDEGNPALFAIRDAGGRPAYIGFADVGHLRATIGSVTARVRGKTILVLYWETREEAERAAHDAIAEFRPKFQDQAVAHAAPSDRAGST
ncbi:MAG: hypothetical protein BGO51_01015 [Rhodospirillales bacterium 69-11]|nr:hypothetical protein [Rhodospirillales bacterium]OJW25588.1 MAG: hypothetical protein BGO51_01015 [Rhodospirillales bacterium 69-11]